jgi:hypothetical protein
VTRNSFFTLLSGLSIFQLGYHFPILARRLIYDFSGEELILEGLRTDIFSSLAHFQLPLWHPLIGPGGSSTFPFVVIPWDYHLLLSPFLGRAQILLLDLLLLGTSYLFLITTLFPFRSKQLPLMLIGFLSFYNLDVVYWLFPEFVFNTAFIATPALIAFIYRMEHNIGRNNALWMYLLYIFSFIGSKPELWLQLIPMLSVITIAFRLFPRSCNEGLFQRMKFYRRDIVYFSILFFGVASQFWQVSLLSNLIAESGRVYTNHAEFWDVFQLFLLSFRYSPVIYLVSCYVLAMLLLRMGDFFRITRWGIWRVIGTVAGLGLLGALLVAFLGIPARQWLDEDLGVLVRRIPWLAMSAVALTFVFRKHFRSFLNGNHASRAVLLIEMPIMTLMLSHFLLEDKSIWNWGPSTIQKSGSILGGLLVAATFLSLLSTQTRSRRIALFSLAALYFLRAHLNVILVHYGMVWHDQRDAIYPSLWFSILIILGLEAALGWIEHIRIKKIKFAIMTAAFALFTVTVIQFQALSYELLPVWITPENALESYRIRKWEAVNNLIKLKIEGSLSTVSVDPNLGIPGGFLQRRIHQVEMYSSVTFKGMKEMSVSFADAQSYVPREGLNSACQLPYLWFSNNIQRALQCPLAGDRGQYYSFSIFPPINVANQSLRELLGIEYLIAFKSNLEKIVPPLQLVGEISPRLSPEIKIGLFRRTGPVAPQFADFQSGATGCPLDHLEARVPAQVKTDYFREPMAKSNFRLSFDAPSRGCLRMKVGYSKLWTFDINGVRVQPEVSDFVFMAVPVEAGRNEIVATYDRRFGSRFVLSVICFAVGLAVVWAVGSHFR